MIFFLLARLHIFVMYPYPVCVLPSSSRYICIVFIKLHCVETVVLLIPGVVSAVSYLRQLYILMNRSGFFYHTPSDYLNQLASVHVTN